MREKKAATGTAFNKHIADIIKKEFKNRVGSTGRAIKLPADLSFAPVEGRADTIRIELSEKNICSNMQEDRAAFEGWILILKSWTSFQRFILSWVRPAGSDIKAQCHYQRFLYRVYKFEKYFSDIFEIDDKCAGLMNDLKIDFNQNDKKYYVNYPGGNNGVSISNKKSESDYEKIFVYRENESICHTAQLNKDKLFRQLPVGLFDMSVSSESRIFTGEKSAVDIWGIGNDNRTINIFELKKEGNNKVGILSELFFYSMFVNDILEGRFVYARGKGKFHRGIGCIISDRIADEKYHPANPYLKNIDAYILAPSIHCLISRDIVKYMNQRMDENKSLIRFDYIKFDPDNFECSKPFQ